MEAQDLEELIGKYLNAECNDEEIAIVESWYLKTLQESNYVPDEKTIIKVNHRMRNAILQHANNSVDMRKPLWTKFAGVAAALFLIFSVVWLFSIRNESNFNSQSLKTKSVSEVRPGGDGAKIILANGKVIRLIGSKKGLVFAKQKVHYDDGTVVEAEISDKLVAATDKKQTYTFTLTDGTKVWLNAGSVLKFPYKFSGKERLVELSGEGYFEVSKDRIHPFIVKTAHQQIKVLGTHFNVDAYDDELATRTTLLEGVVKITTINGTTLLAPGQQMSNFSGKTSVSQVDVEAAIAWKNGYFQFGENLVSIMKKISRWYGVEFEFSKDAPKEEKFWGYISRSNNLSNILHHLEQTKKVRFLIDGSTIKVIKP